MRYARSLLRVLAPVSLLLIVAGSGLLLTGCPKKNPKKAGCKGDKDCPKGRYCVDQQCRECRSDTHCGDGKKCRNGACVVAANMCGKDEDCPEDKVCKNGTCTACENHTECGPGGKCNQGKCERAKKCGKDEDCDDDQDCVNGRCARPWKVSTPTNAACTLGTVYFSFDQASIPPEHRKTLDDAATCIKSVKGRDVYVVGHTDPRGTEEYNVALSERRARSVADYLARLGIDPARMRIIPKGESEARGSSENGYVKDRRVQFEWR